MIKNFSQSLHCISLQSQKKIQDKKKTSWASLWFLSLISDLSFSYKYDIFFVALRD